MSVELTFAADVWLPYGSTAATLYVNALELLDPLYASTLIVKLPPAPAVAL